MARNSQTSVSEEKLSFFLRKNGQQLLPMVDLITQSQVAINLLIDYMGRAMLETILVVSAEQVAGAAVAGKGPEALWCDTGGNLAEFF